MRTGVSWNIFYRPRVPRLVCTFPADGPPDVAGRDGRSLVVRGRFPAIATDREKSPFEVSILCNGKPLPLKAEVDFAQGNLAVKVELEPGVNRLQWRAENQWGGQA